MKPKLLSWNVKVLNEGDKHLRLKNKLRQWKADVSCLQESKLEFVSSSVVRNLWGCQHVDWSYLASRGASGGILLTWDRRVVKKLDVWEKFIVAHSFRNVEDDFSWAFVGVYKPNSDCDRTYLWEELASLISWWNMPRCIGGDFNVTWFPSERSGETRLCPDMVEFSDFIFE